MLDDKEYRMPEEFCSPAEPPTDMEREFNTSMPVRTTLAKKRDKSRLLKRKAGGFIAAAFSAVYVFLPMYGIPLFNADKADSGPFAVAEISTGGYEGKLEFEYFYTTRNAEYGCNARTHHIHHTYYYHTPDGTEESVDLGSIESISGLPDAKVISFFTERGLNIYDARQFYWTSDNYQSCHIEDKEHNVIPLSELPEGYYIADTLPSYVDFTKRLSTERSYYESLRVDNDDEFTSPAEADSGLYDLYVDSYYYTYWVVPKAGEFPEHPAISSTMNDYYAACGGSDAGYAELGAVAPGSVDLDKKSLTLTLSPSVMREQISDTEETLHYMTYRLYFDRSEVPGLKLPYTEREGGTADQPYIMVDPSLPLKDQLSKMAEAYGIDPGRLRFHSEDWISEAAVLLEGTEYSGDPDSILDVNIEKGMITYYHYHTINLVLADDETEKPAISGYEGRLTFTQSGGGSIYAEYDGVINYPERHFIYYYHTPDGKPENLEFKYAATDWDYMYSELKEFFDERGLDVSQAKQFFFTGDNYMYWRILENNNGIPGDVIDWLDLPREYRKRDNLPNYDNFKVDFARDRAGEDNVDNKSWYMSHRIDDDDEYHQEDLAYLLEAVTDTYSYYIVPSPGEEPERPNIKDFNSTFDLSMNEYDPSCGGAAAGYAGLQAVDASSIDLDQKFFTLALRPSVMREKISDDEETLHYIVYYLYLDRNSEGFNGDIKKCPYQSHTSYDEFVYKVYNQVDSSLSLKEQLSQMAEAYGIDPSRLRYHSEVLGTQSAGFLDGSKFVSNPTSATLERDGKDGTKINYKFHRIRLVLADSGSSPAETPTTETPVTYDLNNYKDSYNFTGQSETYEDIEPGKVKVLTTKYVVRFNQNDHPFNEEAPNVPADFASLPDYDQFTTLLSLNTNIKPSELKLYDTDESYSHITMSDDCLPVGDIDDPFNLYVAAGTVYYHYTRTITYVVP